MSVGPARSWSERLLECAIAVLAVALLLDWAWQLLKPLVPIIIMVSGLVVIGRLAFLRHREW